MNFSGRTAVITGAASGIGKKTVEKFLITGAKVAALDINREGLQALQEEFVQYTENTLPVYADITDSNQVDTAMDQIIAWSGQMDFLVNSAGLYVQSMLMEMTDEFWDRTIKINLYGTFYCTRKAAQEMKKKDFGRIVNFSSIAGQRGSVANSHYSATKRGIEGFSKSVALELAEYNINVNCIAPGIILTPIFDEKILAERGDVWLKTIPQGRFGQPEDIANAVLFLCSDYSNYITGITLDVNGGMYIR